MYRKTWYYCTWIIPRSITFSLLHFMLNRGKSISFGTVYSSKQSLQNFSELIIFKHRFLLAMLSVNLLLCLLGRFKFFYCLWFWVLLNIFQLQQSQICYFWRKSFHPTVYSYTVHSTNIFSTPPRNSPHTVNLQYIQYIYNPCKNIVNCRYRKANRVPFR